MTRRCPDCDQRKDICREVGGCQPEKPKRARARASKTCQVQVGGNKRGDDCICGIAVPCPVHQSAGRSAAALPADRGPEAASASGSRHEPTSLGAAFQAEADRLRAERRGADGLTEGDREARLAAAQSAQPDAWRKFVGASETSKTIEMPAVQLDQLRAACAGEVR